MTGSHQVAEVSTKYLADTAGQAIPAGYKQTEVGVIPEDWDVVSLANACKEIGDGIHATPVYSATGEYYFINGNNISNGKVVFDDSTKRVDEIEFSKHQKKLSSNTILLSINGTVGNLAYFNSELLILGKSAAYLDVKDNFSKEFVYYILQTTSTKKCFEDGLTGTTIKNLGLSTIRQTLVVAPQRPEQIAIAHALSDVDALINELEKLIAKKQAIKTATLQQLLTGRTRLPPFALREDGTKKGYKPSELGEIPEDWEVLKLGQLGKFKNGINKDAASFGYGFPFVNLMDVFGKPTISNKTALGLINSTDFDRKEYGLKEGDILFIRSSVKPTGVGLTTVIKHDLEDTVYAGFLIRYRAGVQLSNEFKEHCFYEESFRNRIIAGSTVSANTNINQDTLKEILLGFPGSIQEQTAIANILSDMDTDIQTLQQRLSKTRQIKQGMMQELLTGKTRLLSRKSEVGHAC